MKKLFLLLGVFSFSAKVNAQNLEEIGEMIDKSQYTQARTAVEKFLSNPKKANDAEAWFLKGVVYNAISKDATASADSSLKWKEEAFKAFMLNQKLDPKDIRLTFQQHIPYLDLYFEFMNLGVKYFNQKNFDGALSSFKWANEVKDYIVSKKYEYEQAKLYPLDTSLVRNIAITAFQAKKEEEGIVYLNKLIDANVSGEEFFDVYSTVAEYHLKKNDLTSLNALVIRGKKWYPENNYWFELEIRSIGENPTKQALHKKYEELLAKHPDNFYLSYNYGVELFKSINSSDILTDSQMTQLNRLTEVLKKAAVLEGGNDVSATVLLANHCYRYAYDLQNTAKAIKGTKPDDIKKKNTLKELSQKNIDECLANSIKAVDFIEKVAEKSNMQKANYKILLGFMKEIYDSKADKVKLAEVQKKLDKAE